MHSSVVLSALTLGVPSPLNRGPRLYVPGPHAPGTKKWDALVCANVRMCMLDRATARASAQSISRKSVNSGRFFRLNAVYVEGVESVPQHNPQGVRPSFRGPPATWRESATKVVGQGARDYGSERV